MYERAIVDELGSFLFWYNSKSEKQIENILKDHIDWSIKCIEI